ncbi:retrotransposon protein, putative, ty3-gypsy subclass [Tanacetum coccineum]
MSDRAPRFASQQQRFCKVFTETMGNEELKFKVTSVFHPQTDGQTERTIQTFEDMLRSCALEWTGNWDEYLCLVEFAYNNSWHASIKGALSSFCYNYHPYHVVQYPFDKIREDLSFAEEPEAILDRQERVMRKKTIPLVKVLWKNHPAREATWENEEMMRTDYPHFFSQFGTFPF